MSQWAIDCQKKRRAHPFEESFIVAVVAVIIVRKRKCGKKRKKKYKKSKTPRRPALTD